MNRTTENILTNIAKRLNNEGVLWCVGASVLLYNYDLVDNPTDIDIVVTIDDIHKADRVLSSMGEKLPESESSLYATDYFNEYIIDGVNIDVMAGLKIRIDEGKTVFEYPFDNRSVANTEVLNGVDVPYASLEDWYILYQLMPKREAKVAMIENYLKQYSVSHPYLLERLLRNPSLPAPVVSRVKEALVSAC